MNSEPVVPPPSPEKLREFEKVAFPRIVDPTYLAILRRDGYSRGIATGNRGVFLSRLTAAFDEEWIPRDILRVRPVRFSDRERRIVSDAVRREREDEFFSQLSIEFGRYLELSPGDDHPPIPPGFRKTTRAVAAKTRRRALTTYQPREQAYLYEGDLYETFGARFEAENRFGPEVRDRKGSLSLAPEAGEGADVRILHSDGGGIGIHELKEIRKSSPLFFFVRIEGYDESTELGKEIDRLRAESRSRRKDREEKKERRYEEANLRRRAEERAQTIARFFPGPSSGGAT